MISLALFPPPSTAGGVTLYELNNELVAGPQCEEDTQAFHLQVLGLPPVAIQKDSLKQHSRSDHSTKAAFIHHCESVWKRSGNAWRESGLSGVLCEIAASDDEAPQWLRKVSTLALEMFQWASSIHTSLSPHLTLSMEMLLGEFAHVADWLECPLRAFAWHPHTFKFALGLLDDSVRVYNCKSATVPTLKHRLQKDVSVLAWKPLCASVLAVGCVTCILVWNIDPTSLSTRYVGGLAPRERRT
ncbi:aladin, partial [Scyliorhinus torazame]|uniref:aladin n=1 Tax=Scyliorhinus torazame TaxID=75743 RepID=UPI003B5B8E7B